MLAIRRRITLLTLICAIALVSTSNWGVMRFNVSAYSSGVRSGAADCDGSKGLLSPLSSSSASSLSSSLGASFGAGLSSKYSRLPIRFEVNQGQADRRYKFISRTVSGVAFIGPDGPVITLHARAAKRSLSEGDRAGSTDLRSSRAAAALSLTGLDSASRKSSSVKMTLAGANPRSSLQGLDQAQGKVNYFIGQDPAKWRIGIPAYAAVEQKNVYPGIDLAYHDSEANPGQLEYDFIVAPGADPASMGLNFEGASNVRLEGNGLVMDTPAGALRQIGPTAYQQIGGVRQAVASKYEIKGKGRRSVRFRVGAYDHRLPLVIDPTLVYSTLFGGNAPSDIEAVALDSSGDTILVGDADPAEVPATHGAVSVTGSNDESFVTELDPTGTRVIFTSILGGSKPGYAGAIALDSQGDIYLTGGTLAPDFPVTPGAYQTTLGNTKGGNAYIAKLSPDGSRLLYSTYLGGSISTNVDGFGDGARQIALGPTGIAYVCGVTYDSDFPTTPGAFQTVDRNPAMPVWGAIFVSAINPSATGLVYSTFLDGGPGTNNQGGFNWTSGIGADAQGNAYVYGTAGSPDFPTTPGSFQPQRYGLTLQGGGTVFVSKLNPSGSALVYSTYVGDGGNSDSVANGMAVDALGSAYITGVAFTDDFPAVNAIQPHFSGGLLMKSLDGGIDFSNASAGLPSGSILTENPVIDPANPSTVFVNVSDVLYRSTNAGNQWSPTSSGFPSGTFVSSVAIDPGNGSNVYATVFQRQDEVPVDGSVYQSTDNGDTWSQIGTGVDGNLVIDPVTPSTMYATEGQYNSQGAVAQTVIMKSTDGGHTWAAANQGVPTGTFVNTIAVDPKTTSNLYAGTEFGLFKSTNAGGNWTKTSLKLNVPSISIDPDQPSTLYALDTSGPTISQQQAGGSGRGNPHKRAAQDLPVRGVVTSSNGGDSWAAINDGLFEGMSFNVIAVDPKNSANIYLGAYEGLFVKTGSQDWAAVQGAGNKVTFSLALDSANEGTIYLGGEGGVASSNAFVAKLSPDGASLMYSTLLGGFAQDYGRGIAVDPQGDAFITGSAESSNFPVTPNAIQSKAGGQSDVFLTELNPSGSAILFSTYFGGSDDDFPLGIAVDPIGNVVVCGATHSDDFPLHQPIQSEPFSTHGITESPFVFKISMGSGAAGAALKVTGAAVKGKKLTVTGQGFGMGAVIVVNGTNLPTTNQAAEPATTLISKSGSTIPAGQAVMIQVRNPDGTMSNQLSYTRP